MKINNKKIKFKLSTKGFEFEVSGYESKEALTLAKKVMIFIIIVCILCILFAFINFST